MTTVVYLNAIFAILYRTYEQIWHASGQPSYTAAYAAASSGRTSRRDRFHSVSILSPLKCTMSEKDMTICTVTI